MKSLGLISAVALLALPLVALSQQASRSPDRPVSENISMCTGCHTIPGYQASFPRVYRVPMISGQSAKYIEAALLAYKKGERSHPTMRAIAGGLTDKEIAEIAAYYAARGAGATVAAK
ncbi:MAG: cytochrome c [Burkholderiales bacterium]|jgi:cytochrome c553|nr:cytochrome c [Burkholderiales bacterium]